MSRSYKKYPHVRDRHSKKKRFRTAYNRHLRHTDQELVNGGHYRKLPFGFSLPEYDYYKGYYQFLNESLEDVRRSHESLLKQQANGHHQWHWFSSRKKEIRPLEELEREWRKTNYYK